MRFALRALLSWFGLLGTLALAVLPARAGAQAVGSEFQINTITTGYQGAPAVASDASGNFVVVWHSFDGSNFGIFGQRFDNGGVAQGGEFRVNSYTTNLQGFPAVARAPDGRFVVVWSSRDQDGSYNGVFGQRFDSAGVAQGGEFRVNSYTTSGQTVSSVASDASGNFVVVWMSAYQDGSSWGIFGQRYSFGADTITVVSPNTNVKWRIGSLKRIKWTHNLGIDATFRIKLDRDGDGDYEELIAAAAPAESGTRGQFAWTVTGPVSGTARVRVSWTEHTAVSDASDVTFQIRPAN